MPQTCTHIQAIAVMAMMAIRIRQKDLLVHNWSHRCLSKGENLLLEFHLLAIQFFCQLMQFDKLWSSSIYIVLYMCYTDFDLIDC